MSKQKFRLVTRSDFDGLVCAVLFKELGMIDDIKFVHPKDMQDGKVELNNRDITTNLPYVNGVYLAFDHHHSETVRVGKKANHVIDSHAMSAARVVYDYYGGKERFPKVSDAMMDAVDKADAARFSRDEILHPDGWVLLNYLMDPRTGLGRFRQFRISNYNLMMDLIDCCRDLSIEEILALPDVKERVDLFQHYSEEFKAQLKRVSRIEGRVCILDLRQEETIYPGNRFMIYALHPEVTVSVHVLWGFRQQNTVLAVGKSIINRSASNNVGELCLRFGGGGHQAAGTCQVAHEEAEKTLEIIVETFREDGSYEEAA